MTNTRTSVFDDIETVEGSEATYCPEDNKLRLYCGRVDRACFEALRKLGYRSTPKQDCDFVSTWSVSAEHAATLIIEEGDSIGDEDQSPEDRAADRAERFAGYREKRAREAHQHADDFDAGPDAHGNQSEARARREANRQDRSRLRAVGQWSKAEYWQRRTAGVIANALHKSDPSTRRGRILRLEAEQRGHLKDIEKAQAEYDIWVKVAEMEPGDKQDRAAYHIANVSGLFRKFQHPRDPETSGGLYHLLVDPVDPITGAEAAKLYVDNTARAEPGRGAEQYVLRLEYERAMLANEGGSVDSLDIVPGGRFGEKYLVVKVNKSRATGRPVSVGVWDSTGEGDEVHRVNIQRLGEETYKAPTEESKQAVKDLKARLKKSTQTANADKPKLLNPTEEDAQRLQDALNRRERRGQEPSEILKMTGAEYASQSKGTYSKYGTRFLLVDGSLYQKTDMWTPQSNVQKLCKVRTRSNGWSAPRVVVLTDKPTKPLPAWTEAEVKA